MLILGYELYFIYASHAPTVLCTAGHSFYSLLGCLSIIQIQAVFIHPPFVLLFQPSQEQISKFASLGSKNGAAYDEILPFKPEPGALSICDDVEEYPHIYRYEGDR